MVKVIDYDEQGNVRVTRVFNGEIKEEKIYRKEDIEVISEEDFEIPIKRISLKNSTKSETKDLFDSLIEEDL
ncbi:hypothetical protein [Cytobacillus horneckiae]|uniref:Uncharacterized protein n=1 Tax=Cytobacillus horneckiae TaxID=549687 RepID=A0A2N0Z9G5_9BACI|nr:hypothetical protein [Cytobacillus horneckiae]PKG26153.1 hypothetical protein CWS20_25405 [Cytobacillus horneckiae]